MAKFALKARTTADFLTKHFGLRLRTVLSLACRTACLSPPTEIRRARCDRRQASGVQHLLEHRVGSDPIITLVRKKRTVALVTNTRERVNVCVNGGSREDRIARYQSIATIACAPSALLMIMLDAARQRTAPFESHVRFV
jgi:hypothetical protein